MFEKDLIYQENEYVDADWKMDDYNEYDVELAILLRKIKNEGFHPEQYSVREIKKVFSDIDNWTIISQYYYDIITSAGFVCIDYMEYDFWSLFIQVLFDYRPINFIEHLTELFLLNEKKLWGALDDFLFRLSTQPS